MPRNTVQTSGSEPIDPPAFLSDLDADSLVYRGLVMTGRSYALADAFSMVRRLSERIETDGTDDQTLQTLVLNWSELLTWLEQAGDEARDELRLMQQELDSADT